METFTLLVEGNAVEGPARVGAGTAHLLPDPAWSALGAPLREEATVEEVAARLDRPLALDLGARTGYLGVSARVRAERLASLVAPDFTLLDLDGRPHSLMSHRGAKVLMVAWGSW